MRSNNRTQNRCGTERRRTITERGATGRRGRAAVLRNQRGITEMLLKYLVLGRALSLQSVHFIEHNVHQPCCIAGLTAEAHRHIPPHIACTTVPGPSALHPYELRNEADLCHLLREAENLRQRLKTAVRTVAATVNDAQDGNTALKCVCP